MPLPRSVVSQQRSTSSTSSQRPARWKPSPTTPSARVREGVLQLVAVVEDRPRRHGGLELEVGEPADPPQGVRHLLRLGIELRLVGEILEAAAAASRVVGAGSLDARGALLDDLDRHRLGVAPLHLGDAGAHEVARERAVDEDDEAVQARDATPAVRERVDPELDLLSFLTGAPPGVAPGVDRLVFRARTFSEGARAPLGLRLAEQDDPPRGRQGAASEAQWPVSASGSAPIG